MSRETEGIVISVVLEVLCLTLETQWLFLWRSKFAWSFDPFNVLFPLLFQELTLSDWERQISRVAEFFTFWSCICKRFLVTYNRKMNLLKKIIKNLTYWRRIWYWLSLELELFRGSMDLKALASWLVLERRIGFLNRILSSYLLLVPWLLNVIHLASFFWEHTISCL